MSLQFPISFVARTSVLLPFVQLIAASPCVPEEYFSRLFARTSCLQQIRGTAATVGSHVAQVCGKALLGISSLHVTLATR